MELSWLGTLWAYGRGHKKVPIVSAHYVGSTSNVEKKAVIERFDNTAFVFIDEAFIENATAHVFVSVLHSACFDPCKKTVMTDDLQVGLEGSPQHTCMLFGV